MWSHVLLLLVLIFCYFSVHCFSDLTSHLKKTLDTRSSGALSARRSENRRETDTRCPAGAARGARRGKETTFVTRDTNSNRAHRVGDPTHEPTTVLGTKPSGSWVRAWGVECEDAARAYLYFSLPMLAAVRPASPTSGSSSSSSS